MLVVDSSYVSSRCFFYEDISTCGEIFGSKLFYYSKQITSSRGNVGDVNSGYS